MKENKHIGVYGLVIKNNQILLIKKITGPYDGKLDLPGGSLEFGERPENALKREFLEETGLEITNYTLLDVDSVSFIKPYQENNIHFYHIAVFYKIEKYLNEIKQDIEIDLYNDDSLGADFYNIDELRQDNLSDIAVLILNKLGYNLK